MIWNPEEGGGGIERLTVEARVVSAFLPSPYYDA